VVLQGGNLLLQGAPQSILSEALLEQVFGLQVALIPHPKSDIPWVVPL
jgi:ABC-type hemin transport system ATPase subunit